MYKGFAVSMLKDGILKELKNKKITSIEMLEPGPEKLAEKMVRNKMTGMVLKQIGISQSELVEIITACVEEVSNEANQGQV